MPYSPEDIVGKHLHAASSVPIRKLPLDSAPVIGYFNKLDYVGQVYSYMIPKPGRSTLYWMFYDAQGRAYYTPQQEGLYSEAMLRNQGVRTNEEKEIAEQPEWYRLGRDLALGAITTYGVFRLAAALINRK
jgi:hypothetical protein